MGWSKVEVTEDPRTCGPLRRFLLFQCTAKRVTGHGVDNN